MRLIAASLLAIVLVASAAAATVDIVPLAEVRVRQEVLEGVYHFDPAQQDRDWLRVRTRLGAALTAGAHHAEVRLVNEHRHVFTPDTDLDWDEVLVDRLSWRWTPRADLSVTAGRQDIIWPGGFLVLEGHPLDGSRTIFHDGLRLQAELPAGQLDLAVVHNRQRPGLVLLGDEHRDLNFGDETGVLARLVRGAWGGSFIIKDQRMRTYTTAVRYAGGVGGAGKLEAELALQYQQGGVPVRWDDRRGKDHGWALAGQAFATRGLGRDLELQAGAFYYSGAGDRLRPFQVPWGSWPKWSELYIYTLLGESTPGRPHVGHWENVAAPRVQLRRPLHRRVDGRLGATWLLAPEPELLSRGVLIQAGVEARITAAIAGHLLVEWFDPGVFHDGRGGLAPLDDAISFFRWQLEWTF